MSDDLEPQELSTSELDDLRAALHGAEFLNPTSREPAEPMPQAVWSRLESVLHAEAATRAAASHENVVLLSSNAQRAPRPSRPMRWAGGLVAASVAVVAVGLAVGVTRGTDEAVTVAGGALASATPATMDRATAMESAPEAQVAQAPPGEEPDEAIVPAAKIVLASNTNYLPEELPGQVVALVKNAGFRTPQDAMSKQMPTSAMPVEDGFTASWAALRECLTALTKSADSQALIVDRAMYAGDDAGVIVAFAIPDDADPATPSPTYTIDTTDGSFDVWVVNPECEKVEQVLDDFALYEWHK